MKEDKNDSIDNLIEYSEQEDDISGNTQDELIFDTDESDEEAELEYPQLEDEVNFDDIETIPVSEIPYYFEETVQHKKEKNYTVPKGAIIGILIGLLTVLAFICFDSGIIGAYKRNFAHNFSVIFRNFAPDRENIKETEPKKVSTQYKTDIKSSVMVAPENATGSKIISYKEGIVCASSNHLSYINSLGETVWEIDTAIVEPIAAAEGNYILLAEKGRNKLCLYADKKLVYDVDDTDNIMAIKVSARGDAVAVTDKSSYRGGISVYNKSGEQIYSWASGRDTVVSADISSASRRIAVALLNTEVRAKSMVQLFDVNQEKSYSQINIEDTVIYNVEFSGSMLSAFGDNRLSTFTDGGRVISDTVIDEDALTHSAMDSVGNKVLSVDDGFEPSLRVYTRRSSLKNTIPITSSPDFIDIEGKYVIYSLGRDIYFGKANGKNMIKYTAVMDIKNLILLSEDTYVIVYSNSFEIIKV